MSISTTRPRAHHDMLSALVPLAAWVVLLVMLFWPECTAAISVWYTSTAYGHCFLVLPIAAYMIWDRREGLVGLIPNPTPVLAVLGLPLVFVWLAAERLGIMEGRQIVFILMLEVLFLTALGWHVFQALMGPLLYLIFLVPFGAFLTPLLQSFTASFIDVGLTILRIPHFVNAMVIEISAGTFYVAEACAGLRFLIASVAFGVFFALLNYQSYGRRLTFIIASILIPIVANGFRALGIVVLGNILGSAEAAAADHIVYGWLFFSVVMLLLVMIGLPFREPPHKTARSHHNVVVPHGHPWAALLLLLVAATGPATARALDSRAKPARLSQRPVFAPLPGCTIMNANSLTQQDDRSTTTMTCAERIWTIIMQVVPAKSTASQLTEVRHRLIGVLNEDETTTTSLSNTPGWQIIVSGEPAQITAVSSWLDGHVSEGGLEQRVVQARHSVFGANHEPMVMSITTKSARVFSDAESRAVVADISHFLELQPDLAGMIGRLTSR